MEKNINLNKDEVNEIKKPKSPIYKARKKTSNFPYLIYEKKDASDTSSSIDGDKKNSTLFNHLLNKKESVNKKHSFDEANTDKKIKKGNKNNLKNKNNNIKENKEEKKKLKQDNIIY